MENPGLVKPKGQLKVTKVLVAEPYFVTAVLLKEWLEYFNLSIVLVSNRHLALEKVEEHEFDLLLIDARLNGDREGLLLLKQVREFEQRKNIKPTPAIALSTWCTQEARQAIAEAGFSCYVSKPFQPEDLLKTMQELLSIRCY